MLCFHLICFETHSKLSLAIWLVTGGLHPLLDTSPKNRRIGKRA